VLLAGGIGISIQVEILNRSSVQLLWGICVEWLEKRLIKESGILGGDECE